MQRSGLASEVRQVRQWVGDGVIHTKLEVHVRAGRPSGGPFEPDALTPQDLVPNIDIRLEQVSVKGHNPAAVRNHDVVAVTDTGVTYRDDHAGGGRHDRGAERRRDVETRMEMLVRTKRRFEQEVTGAEELRHPGSIHRPDEA